MIILPFNLEKISLIALPTVLSEGVNPSRSALVESDNKHKTPSLPICANLSYSAAGPTGV